MNLHAIKNYLMERRLASLNDLARYFECDPVRIKEALNYWLAQGKVKQLPQDATSDLYQWQEGSIAMTPLGVCPR